MIDRLPYAEACEQNKDPILQVLREQFTEPLTVLEIGSGTGQHAVYFTEQMPHLRWQPTDRAEYLAGISSWIEHAQSSSVLPPIELDVSEKEWQIKTASGIFCSNAIHIMSWNHVIALFGGVKLIAEKGAKLVMYGPFNYGNEYTSESNRQFDTMLRSRDPLSGIRNFEDVDELANAAGFSLLKDYAMPANNRTIVWQKTGR